MRVPGGDDQALMEVLYSRGPVAVAIDASQDTFRFYSSGEGGGERGCAAPDVPGSREPALVPPLPHLYPLPHSRTPSPTGRTAVRDPVAATRRLPVTPARRLSDTSFSRVQACTTTPAACGRRMSWTMPCCWCEGLPWPCSRCDALWHAVMPL